MVTAYSFREGKSTPSQKGEAYGSQDGIGEEDVGRFAVAGHVREDPGDVFEGGEAAGGAF
jgi:hypothetical protein